MTLMAVQDEHDTAAPDEVDVDLDADGFLLKDAGSLNGTYVNKKRVDEARLHYGDELQVGKFKLTYISR